MSQWWDPSSNRRKYRIEKQVTDKEIKMAKGIAFDPRYKGGNMTGAVNAIEKIKKGLSSHPEVEKALKSANEDKNFHKLAVKKTKKKLKLEK